MKLKKHIFFLLNLIIQSKLELSPQNIHNRPLLCILFELFLFYFSSLALFFEQMFLKLIRENAKRYWDAHMKRISPQYVVAGVEKWKVFNFSSLVHHHRTLPKLLKPLFTNLKLVKSVWKQDLWEWMCKVWKCHIFALTYMHAFVSIELNVVYAQNPMLTRYHQKQI